MRQESSKVRVSNVDVGRERMLIGRSVKISIAILVLATLWFSQRLRAEEDPQKALDAQLNAQRAAAESRSVDTSKMTPDEQKAYATKMKAAKDKEDKKKNLAEYKEKTLNNLAAIKEMFTKAEDAWKNKKFHDAGSFYSSVAMATVPGSEEMAETSRNRLVEMEELGKEHLKSADDEDLKRDYVKEVDELSMVTKEFALTKSHDVALRRLISLKGRPEVAGYVQLAQAEALEGDGKLSDALKLYDDLSSNPRYEHSVAALKAKRKLDELNGNESTRNKIKSDMDAKADKEAPLLLASAKNFVANNMPKQAIEKLEQVIEKYPDSKYAESAKKQLSQLK